jgi:hypothetical protein
MSVSVGWQVGNKLPFLKVSGNTSSGGVSLLLAMLPKHFLIYKQHDSPPRMRALSPKMRLRL